MGTLSNCYSAIHNEIVPCSTLMLEVVTLVMTLFPTDKKRDERSQIIYHPWQVLDQQIASQTWKA